MEEKKKCFICDDKGFYADNWGVWRKCPKCPKPKKKIVWFKNRGDF